MIEDPLFNLLASCAHLEQTADQRLQIHRFANAISDWTKVINEVEMHGMAPLLYFHLRKAGAEIPADIQRNLTALALRHKLINEVRTRTLVELQSIFAKHEIPFLILKGAALGHWLYPSPALRPMKDVDLLVRSKDCDWVTEILTQHGFRQIIDKFFHPSELHLPTFSKQIEGFTISLEVHHRLLPEDRQDYWGQFETLRLPHQEIEMAEGKKVQTINPGEFLYHLCRHTFFSYHNLEPLRMIWVADICNFSEKFQHEIDWIFLNQQYPLVRHTLAALHEIFPLSSQLITIAKIEPRKKTENRIRPYRGWPGIPMRDVRTGERWQWFKETCFPSGWVLYLQYGNGRVQAKWYNWLKHMLNLFSIVIVHMKIRLKTGNN